MLGQFLEKQLVLLHLIAHVFDQKVVAALLFKQRRQLRGGRVLDGQLLLQGLLSFGPKI